MLLEDRKVALTARGSSLVYLEAGHMLNLQLLVVALGVD